MGWLTPDEQNWWLRHYKVRFYYVCDYCKKPIVNAPLIDPKSKYFKWPKSLPKSCRTFLSREPMTTYHTSPCGEMLFSKSGRKVRLLQEAAKASVRILRRLRKRKPKGYWTKERLFKHYRGKFDERVVKKALSILRKEKRVRRRKGGYITRKRI